MASLHNHDQNQDCYIGVDIGGTMIKAGIVNASGELLKEEDAAPTGADRPQDVVLKDILHVVEHAREMCSGHVRAVGVCAPGAVIADSGTVLFNGNLGWRNFAIGPEMERELGIPVRVENDANAAALGEVVAGSAKGASSAMIITLGTGVGSGFVIDGHIWTGYNEIAGEFGHMVIVRGGRPCTCGRKGCFEAYASATGLILSTKEAIAAHPESLMAKIAQDSGEVNGRTPFDAARAGDPVAIQVVNEYVDYLACGFANLINGLRPEVISIGGGVSLAGDALLIPLREALKKEVFGAGFFHLDRETRIVPCTLGNTAGTIGAAMAAKLNATKFYKTQKMQAITR